MSASVLSIVLSVAAYYQLLYVGNSFLLFLLPAFFLMAWVRATMPAITVDDSHGFEEVPSTEPLRFGWVHRALSWGEYLFGLTFLASFVATIYFGDGSIPEFPAFLERTQHYLDSHGKLIETNQVNYQRTALAAASAFGSVMLLFNLQALRRLLARRGR